MDTLEHEGFPEGLQELAAAVHVSPILRRVHVLRARMARRLVVAEANVTDRIELTKISVRANEKHRITGRPQYFFARTAYLCVHRHVCTAG